MGNKSSSGNGGNPPPSESENNEEYYTEESSSDNTTTTTSNQQQRSRTTSTPTTPTTANTSNKSPSYYTLIKNSYQALVNAIIRPPRSTYDVNQLGPPRFKFCGRTIQRTDFTLINSRNLKIVCSLWEPVDADRPSPVLPCVIYMHGNSSSRLEGLSALSLVLTLGATLLAFDFAGSGLSEGEYVSLGAFEKEDLQSVIEHLRGTGTTSTIALWGRSMGAATALLHGERDPSIAAMVLDSSFADLVMLAEEMVEKGRQQGLFAPSILVKIAIKFVRSSVQKQANFDIKTLSPIEHADKCFIPALFIAAENDNFVIPSHSQKIFDKYGGDKNIMIVEGDHNTPRPRYLFDAVAIFLQSTLQIPDTWILAEGHEYIRRLPWTYRATNNHIYNPSMYGKLSIDELLALQLMEEMGPNVDEQSEQAMQRGVKEQLYNFLSGGGGSDSSSKKEPNTSGKAGVSAGTIAKPQAASNPLPPPPMKNTSGKIAPPAAPPIGATLIDIPESNEKCPSEMTTIARKYSKSSEDMKIQTTRKSSRTSADIATQWICNTCTLINNIQHDICEACGLLRCG